MEKRDLVAQYPKDISDYLRINGKLPEDFEMSSTGARCIWGGKRYFVLARVVLPLKAFDNGVGFRLWVEVTKEDHDKLMEAVKSYEAYMKFVCEGTLANEWAGFENMKGTKVRIRPIRKEEKLYITEVLETKDPLFEIAALTATDDEKGIKRIEELVVAYVNDEGFNKPLD